MENQQFFTVTFNVSQLTKNSDESHLIMLLDETKMTLVYEVVEWIRWIFSVNSCLHLTHNESIIHSTEKIRILAFLKTVDVKLCTSKAGCCYFSKLDNSILKKLHFFQDWNTTKIPKIFAEDLNSINSKLNLGNEKEDHLSEKQNKSVYLNQITSKQNSTKPISLPALYSGQQNHDAKASNSNLNKISLEMSEEEFNEKESEQNKKKEPEKKNTYHSEQYQINCLDGNDLEESTETHLKSDCTKKESTIKNKFGNYGRPFSIGETLNFLRNSLESSSEFHYEKNSFETGSHSAPAETNYIWEKSLSSLSSPLYNVTNVKKRKRIRRSKSKKKYCEEPNKLPVENEKITWNNDNNSIKEIKSKHIRFNSSDNSESDVNEEKSTSCTFLNEDVKDCKNSQPMEMQQNEILNGKNSSFNANNKIQNNSLNSNEKSQDTVQNVTYESVLDSESQNFAKNRMEIQPPKTKESNIKSPDNSVLMSLKNFFQNPVVIDRF